MKSNQRTALFLLVGALEIVSCVVCWYFYPIVAITQVKKRRQFDTGANVEVLFNWELFWAFNLIGLAIILIIIAVYVLQTKPLNAMGHKGKFKVGDIVKYKSSEDLSKLYKILADNANPLKTENGDLFPTMGNDYIIVDTEAKPGDMVIHTSWNFLSPKTDYTHD